MTELYKKYRPKKLSDMVGQDEAVEMLTSMLAEKNLPHALLFSGPSGTGKTTLARICAKKLLCKKPVEINVADFRGIDTIRDIRSRMNFPKLGSTTCVWILDECQTLRSDTQTAFLKILEDGDRNGRAYFMLATTHPQKLIPTVRNRCTHIKTKSVTEGMMNVLLIEILGKEKRTLHSTVRDKIVEVSDGSPRKALVFLEQVLAIKDKRKQLDSIISQDVEKQVYDMFKLLMWGKPTWPQVAKVLGEIDEEPESIRMIILASASTTLRKNNSSTRCVNIIDLFSENYYESGRAGLDWSCFMACQTPKRR